MFKKIVFILTIITFTAYPTVPLLAQANSSPNGNGGLNQNQNQEIILQSPQNIGDFLIPENNETAPDPAGTIPVEKKEGTIIENPAGTAPVGNSDDKKEEPPVTDDLVPSQSLDQRNAVVTKDHSNLFDIAPSGAFISKYPIVVPKGRNNLEPQLQLTYNNQDKNNQNLFGNGWSMDIPSIERFNKTGMNNLYSTSTTNYFSASFSGELIEKELIAENVYIYVSVIESGDYYKYVYVTSTNIWTATDKQGTVYTFGETAGSRQDDPNNAEHVFKWMLSEVRDTNDNFISYSYYKNDGQIYPDTITYTGYDETEGIFEIEFLREERVDKLISYITGFGATTTDRIYEIQAKINNDWVKKYDFYYTTGYNGTRSILDHITESGKDSLGNTIQLNPDEFNYNSVEEDWTQTTSTIWYSPVNFAKTNDNSDSGARLEDVNGDGLVDIIGNNNTVNINNGSGWEYDESWYYPVTNVDSSGKDLGVRMADVNGDSLTDILRTGWYSEYDDVFFNYGNGWTKTTSTSWDIPVAFLISTAPNGDSGARLVDVNNDGLTDIVQSGSFYNYNNVFLNNGNGWDPRDPDWYIPVAIVDANSKDMGVRFADVNGDGLVDILRTGSHSEYDDVFLNNGHGWTKATAITWDLPVAFLISTAPNGDSGARIADVNGDGLTDIIQAGSFYNYNNVFLNNGNGWNVDHPDWYIPVAFVDTLGYSADTGARQIDFNGDGLTDIIQAGSSNYYNKAFIKNGSNNNLSSIHYNNGSSVSVEYQPSTQIKEDDDTFSNPDLPNILDTVKQIDVFDGLATSITTYHFKGGENYYNNPYDKKFAGFSETTKTQDNQKTITYLHQGNDTNSSQGEYVDSFAKIGKPYRVEVYDNTITSSPVLLKQDIFKWNSYDLFTTTTATSTFVYLEQSTDSLFNNSAEHKDTAKTYTYDYDNGNLLTELNKGEGTANIQTGEFTDDPGDEKLTTYEYATSPEALHILGAPMNKVISDPNLTSQIHQDYYYDNLPLGQVEHLNVTKEDLPDQTIDYEYTYNEYGLVTQKKDPYENTTTITYDQYNLYPITTTNALNQTVETTYDLYTGQLLESTDPNGLVTQNTYDALGRLIEVKTSDPANPSQLITKEIYEYHDFDFPWWIKYSVYSTTTAPAIDTYTYLDGFGRVIQEKNEAESGNFSTVDYWYDERGNLERQTLPYFTQTSVFTIRNENQPNNFYTYDGLNRVLTVVNSLGTTSNSYDLWKTTITDANNKSKNIYHDAYNRLSQVDEILDSTTYSTNYDYNYLNLIINITDSQGNLKNYFYDDLGRLTSQQEMHKATSTTFGTWSYEYDLNSNLTQKVDPKNQVIAYIYDDLNRILTEDSDTTVGTTDVSYVYDQGTNGIGRLTSVTKNTNPSVSTSYTYDILGRALTETKNIKGRVFNTGYIYNLLNNPLTINYPENLSARYVYNSVGQTDQVYYTAPSQAEQQIVSNVDYSPLGQISKINYTNGTETNNTYDPSQLYRLSLKQTTKATTTLQNIEYTYDPVGNITQIVDTAPNQLAKTADYVYDDLYRLTTATITTSTVTTLTFNYDPIGNITNKSDLGDYTYANINPYQANQINGVSQTYDNNGNLTNDTLKTLAYDYQDRLTSVSPVGYSTVNYYYDHTKQRVAKYKPDTGAYKMYPNKYYEKSNTKEDNYVFLGDLRIATFEKVGTTTSTYLNFTDHLNSASVTTDANGNITNMIDYLPYGADRVSVKLGSFNPTYKFTDQESDQESGLYYYDARYYNQGIGRFIQIDPVSLVFHDDKQLKEKTNKNLAQLLENPQVLNNYSYTVNNPLKYNDPTGEWFKEFLTGRQSWSSFQMEIGQAAMYMSPTWQTAMDHPYITGGITGVAGGLAALAGSAVLGQGGLALATKVIPATTAASTQANKVAEQTTKLLNPPINITENALNKISQVHEGAYNGLKSVFNQGENVAKLIQKTTQSQMIPQIGNKFARIVNLGRNIGIDKLTGQQTQTITVITNAANNLITAYPGIPTYLTR